MGNPDSSSFLPGIQPTPLDGVSGALGAHTGGIPSSALQGALPARPNLPDDPVIPHNGFATFEEGEKAFIHLLRKAGIDANWTWDQTMRTIITDPLYKALNTLAEKKAAWQKVR
jgi:pre-mRNA-processing factor 40